MYDDNAKLQWQRTVTLIAINMLIESSRYDVLDSKNCRQGPDTFLEMGAT